MERRRKQDVTRVGLKGAKPAQYLSSQFLFLLLHTSETDGIKGKIIFGLMEIGLYGCFIVLDSRLVGKMQILI